MREITTHRAAFCKDTTITITVLDEPGSGGANHCYRLSVIPHECWERQADGSEVMDVEKTAMLRQGCDLVFQHGPVKEVGTNGITNEALLAIVIDRLEGFQRGDYRCRDNALALTKLEEALHWLHHRTLGRVARGVEGTMAK